MEPVCAAKGVRLESCNIVLQVKVLAIKKCVRILFGRGITGTICIDRQAVLKPLDNEIVSSRLVVETRATLQRISRENKLNDIYGYRVTLAGWVMRLN